MEVEFTAAYPEQVPKFSILTTSGRINDLEALQRHVSSEALQSLGMAMVYTMVSCIEEWLAEHMKPVSSSLTLNTKGANDENTVRQPEDIPLTMKGGLVTPESFATWNAKFLAERSQSQAQLEHNRLLNRSGPAKLTGRELFEQNRALAASDALIGDEVVLDSAAFEGLDDLRIDDQEDFLDEAASYSDSSDSDPI